MRRCVRVLAHAAARNTMGLAPRAGGGGDGTAGHSGGPAACTSCTRRDAAARGGPEDGGGALHAAKAARLCIELCTTARMEVCFASMATASATPARKKAATKQNHGGQSRDRRETRRPAEQHVQDMSSVNRRPRTVIMLKLPMTGPMPMTVARTPRSSQEKPIDATCNGGAVSIDTREA